MPFYYTSLKVSKKYQFKRAKINLPRSNWVKIRGLSELSFYHSPPPETPAEAEVCGESEQSLSFLHSALSEIQYL